MASFDLFPKIFKFKLSRALDNVLSLPINFTISLKYDCNARCKTCNVYTRKVDELTLEEWDNIFSNIGTSPYEFIFTGGEPFMRKDIVQIIQSAYRNCRPKVIIIPTNGMLFSIIPDKVEEIVKTCPDSQIVLNISLDGVGEQNDYIRGIKGYFEKSMKTFALVREFNYSNFELKIHTVVSKYNVDSIPQIYDYFVSEVGPNSYITEIAEERVELQTVGLNITPNTHQYSNAVDFLIQKIKNSKFGGFSRITQAFRLEYYNIAKKWLESGKTKQTIPCYAGIASCQITPDGLVWGCCVRAESLGSLRENNYNFKEIWYSQRANEFRRSVKNNECACPLANANYTNILCDSKSLYNVTKHAVSLGHKDEVLESPLSFEV